MSGALVLRDVELSGARTHVRIENGVIQAIGDVAHAGAELIDAKGGALIPGLIDHHIHLFATAARMNSIDLSGARAKQDILNALKTASRARPDDVWIRAIHFDETHAGLLSRDDLDQIGAKQRIRVQDRTGALWVLNSLALKRVLDDAPPACVERDASGRFTGRIWRGDAWLRARIGATPPSLSALSRELARFGIIGVTDTSATNGPEEARLLGEARRHGELLQSLHLMSADAIPPAPEYTIGAIKILPDERDLPELDSMIDTMRRARALNRAVAVHCVTTAELVLSLAAFEAVGARRGDRLEHGGLIPEALFENIHALDLTIVTQPNFIFDRGDRYRETVAPEDLPDLYRLGSLRQAGIALAAGSDAPYGGLNPWSAIDAAARRKTKSGRPLGVNERIDARDALGLYLGGFDDPGGAEREIRVGAPADLCLLASPLEYALAAPRDAHILATIARGEAIYRAS